MDPEENTEHHEPEINEAQVQPDDEIVEVPVSAIVPQNQDPLFLELQRERNRRPKKKDHLTPNKNLARVEPINDNEAVSSDSIHEEPEPEPLPAPPPSLPVGIKKDPIRSVAQFLGGKKKNA